MRKKLLLIALALALVACHSTKEVASSRRIYGEFWNSWKNSLTATDGSTCDVSNIHIKAGDIVSCAWKPRPPAEQPAR